MRYLWLTDEQARVIAGHARAEAPRETCGIIGGVDGQAKRIIPAANVAAEPLHMYTLDPAALVKAAMELRADGLEIIGFYHSHPESAPRPSQTDIRLASYPDTAYLIVSLAKDDAEFSAWRIQYGEVQRLPLHVGSEPPEVADDAPLSKAQKAAIIISALLAFAIMLTISLSLLPPAPEIPLIR
jgi:proteasome lid subunit RPN8/RPN11